MTPTALDDAPRRGMSAFDRFCRTQATGALPMLVAAAIATLVANSALGPGWQRIWSESFSAGLGGRVLDLSVPELVDQGLMALLMMVLTLEVKRQYVAGELAERGSLAAPVAAALGGALVSAAAFLALNRAYPEVRGGAIPMATDVALVLGVAAVAARRLPTSARRFVALVAIFDSLAAVAVICVLGTFGIDWAWLGASVVVGAALVGLNRAGVRRPTPYLLVGVVLWAVVMKSGIQATLTGVLVALAIPAKSVGGGVPPAERLEAALHPWVAYGVVPLFVLLNAGVRFTGDGLAYYMASRRVAAGVLLALLVAKPLGTATGALLARAFAKPPRHQPSALQVAAVSMLASAGFSTAILVANLAYPQGSRFLNGARVAIVVASLVMAALGGLTLAVASRTAAEKPDPLG